MLRILARAQIAVAVVSLLPEPLLHAAQKGDEPREQVVARAKVWRRTDIAAMDLRGGPGGTGTFGLAQTVLCVHVKRDLSGASPKFACQLSNGDELKIKFGGSNGEVYGEILATRLLWALGFGADRMYSVRVICRGCPEEFGGILRQNGDRIFEPAAVERKLPHRELSDRWDWEELQLTDASQGGATRAERDALTLLAVLLQHSDSKPQNQRIVCLDEATSDDTQLPCAQPMMMLQDVGNTFGRANAYNQQPRASVNLAEWAEIPVWKPGEMCVGNLSGSWMGTLKDPLISEEGRQFLADLLSQLSDPQLYGLFEAARVHLRPVAPASGRSRFPSIGEWVDAFKEKRRQIVDRRCPA